MSRKNLFAPTCTAAVAGAAGHVVGGAEALRAKGLSQRPISISISQRPSVDAPATAALMNGIENGGRDGGHVPHMICTLFLLLLSHP